MTMKPVLTDKELVMRYVSDKDDLNYVQFSYLCINKYIDNNGNLTTKGIETAYGKIDDNRKGTGKIF